MEPDDDFVPASERAPPNPLVPGRPGVVEDMVWFGLVPGLIINKMRQRKAERGLDPSPIGALEELSYRELAALEESLAETLDHMSTPPGMGDEFTEGYECHVRLMRWMTGSGKRGQAIRHALDVRDGEKLLEFLGETTQEKATHPEFFLGFQAANGDLAARFERLVPR